jgi:dienelactone hydrolase
MIYTTERVFNMLARTLAIGFLIMGLNNVQAEIKTETVSYDYEGVKFQGAMVYDDSIKGKRPGVMVVHEWWGLNEYAKERSAMLAKMGYIAFACDLYGEGKLAKHPTEAGQMAGEVRKNAAVWNGRALKSLKVLQENPMVDASKLAVIGYCFGGQTAMNIALSGADVVAVASFHGAMPSNPTVEKAKKVKGKILICHGADDTFIPEAAIKQFRDALDSAKTSYEFIAYPGAVHSFTVPNAGDANVKGLAYNEKADKSSWESLTKLLKESFGK